MRTWMESWIRAATCRRSDRDDDAEGYEAGRAAYAEAAQGRSAYWCRGFRLGVAGTRLAAVNSHPDVRAEVERGWLAGRVMREAVQEEQG